MEIASWLVPLGCTTSWVDEPDGPARSLVITLPGTLGKTVALLGHTDTVFGLGEALARPFAVSGDRATGPGVADMKGGLVLAAMAMEQLASEGIPFPEVRLLVCADEEVRLRAPAVARHAVDAAAALVFECARENGDLVSSRKGAVWRTLELTGRPAHAGADTARGRSAVSALAGEITRIEALAHGRPEMTSVITTVSGGDAANTVPGHARATIDIRSSDPADLAYALTELGQPSGHDGVRLHDRGPRHLAADAARRRPGLIGAGDRVGAGADGRRAALGRSVRRMLDIALGHPHHRRPGSMRRARSHARRVDRTRDRTRPDRSRGPADPRGVATARTCACQTP